MSFHPECVSGVMILYEAKSVGSLMKNEFQTLCRGGRGANKYMCSMTIALPISVCFRILSLRVTEKIDFKVSYIPRNCYTLREK